MKLNRLETHDRLIHLHQDQAANLAQGAEDCLKKNPLSLAIQEKCPYVYIFAHPRTADDGVTKRMLWQPRITRPKSQTNSYLFRAQSNSDVLEICWLLPPREQWNQYKKGNVTEHELVIWSIEMFEKQRKVLDEIPKDDLSEERGKLIYNQIIREHREKLKSKPMIVEPSSAFLETLD